MGDAEMSNESDRERKKRIDAIFENVGEAAVQIAVLDRATSKLFPGISSSEPTRDEADAWLIRIARKRNLRRTAVVITSGITLLAAVIGAAGVLFGPFSPSQ